MATDSPAVGPDDVRAILASTSIVDVRLDEVHAGPLNGDLSAAVVRFRRDLAEYGFSEDGSGLLVKFPHTAEWVTEKSGDDVEVLARVSIVHVAQFAITGELLDNPPALSAWIDTNVYFMVYPYVRAAFHSVASLLGYPSFTLGYLKRDDALPKTREEHFDSES